MHSFTNSTVNHSVCVALKGQSLQPLLAVNCGEIDGGSHVCGRWLLGRQMRTRLCFLPLSTKDPLLLNASNDKTFNCILMNSPVSARMQSKNTKKEMCSVI